VRREKKRRKEKEEKGLVEVEEVEAHQGGGQVRP